MSSLPALSEVVTTSGTLAVNDALLAVALLGIAGVLLLLEFLLVSYGLLAIAAFGCALSGIIIGFGSSPVVGWTLLATAPIMAILVTLWGLKRLAKSDLVPKAAVTDDAGYRHATAAVGLTPGARGTLVTDAIPTGRARFPNGDLDVVIEGSAADKGTVVVVIRIEGPHIFVRADSGATA
jgi:membrane-bound ClpP family serine protease